MLRDRLLARDNAVRAGLRRFRASVPPLLGRLRRVFAHPRLIVGVTGSAGKGTVTRLVGVILTMHGKTYCGIGINTSRGIVRTLSRAPLNCRYWVQEMSGHMPGELAASATFVRPHIGVVTMVQNDHFREFPSLEALAEEKSALVAALPRGGVAVLNADDPVVMAMAPLCRGRVTTFGYDPTAGIRVVRVTGCLPGGISVTLAEGAREATISTGFGGHRWAMHFAAAVATGRAAGVPFDECIAALQQAEPAMYKDSVHRLADGSQMVLDTFKAPLWTVPSSLALVDEADTPFRTVVIGTLSDYRGNPRKHYRETALAALEVADRVYMYGPHAYRARKLQPRFPGRLFEFEVMADLHRHMAENAVPGELIYVKGSSSDHLERLLYLRRGPISCLRDRCGLRLIVCDTCKRLYGRRLSPAEREALR